MDRDAASYLTAAGISSKTDELPPYNRTHMHSHKHRVVIVSYLCVPVDVCVCAVGEGEMCDVCLSDMLPPPSSYALSCGHWFCTGCWVGLCKAALGGGQAAIFTAKCPRDGCSVKVGEDAFRRFLSPEELGVCCVVLCWSVLLMLMLVLLLLLCGYIRTLRQDIVVGVCGGVCEPCTLPCAWLLQDRRLHQVCRL